MESETLIAVQPVAPTAAPRLNSLLPQVSAEVLDALLKEVQECEGDEAKLKAIFEGRRELFMRENPILYFRLLQYVTAEQLGWVVYVYRALAGQNQQDMRYPA